MVNTFNKWVGLLFAQISNILVGQMVRTQRSVVDNKYTSHHNRRKSSWLLIFTASRLNNLIHIENRKISTNIEQVGTLRCTNDPYNFPTDFLLAITEHSDNWYVKFCQRSYTKDCLQNHASRIMIDYIFRFTSRLDSLY